MTPMIEFYFWTTPNGQKITMFLEETGPDYFRQHRERRVVRAVILPDHFRTTGYSQSAILSFADVPLVTSVGNAGQAFT
jgi:hypothetical protein